MANFSEKLQEIIRSAGMSLHPEYYVGNGNKPANLHTKELEIIYQGIQENFGADAAKQYVRMVAGLTEDAGATPFLLSLEDLEKNGWKYAPQTDASMTARALHKMGGKVSIPGAIAIISASGLMGGAKNLSDYSAEPITGEFLKAHASELIITRTEQAEIKREKMSTPANELYIGPDGAEINRRVTADRANPMPEDVLKKRGLVPISGEFTAREHLAANAIIDDRTRRK